MKPSNTKRINLERRMVNLNHFFDYLPKRDSLFSEVNYASSFRRYPNPRCGFC